MMNLDRQENGLFARDDWWLAGVVAVAAGVLRLPVRSALAYNWDAAQFVLALREYNVALSQPHAPGYFLYVMLGRLVNWFVGEPHASLVWISVVAGAALCGLLCLLGTALFGRRAGLVAGLLAMTSPQLRFHSGVALTYVVDALLICLTVLCCWRARQRGGSWWDAVLIGGLLAVIGGVRQQSAPALVPLVVATFWKFERHRLAKLLTAAGVAVGLALLWFVPMVKWSGGLAVYWQIVRLFGKFNAPATLFGGGGRAFVANVGLVARWCWEGLLLGAVVLAAALVYRATRLSPARKRDWDTAHAAALQTLALWLVPMLVLAIVAFTKQPGYVLSYLPALLLLIGAAVAALSRRWVVVAVTVALYAANVMGFQFGTLGVTRTAREIRQHDRQLSQVINAARTQFDPKTTVVVVPREYLLFGIRHWQLYLPEFDSYQLDPDPTVVPPAGRPLFWAHGGRLDFAAGVALAGRTNVLLVVPPEWTLAELEDYLPGVATVAQPVPSAARILFVLPVESPAMQNCRWSRP